MGIYAEYLNKNFNYSQLTTERKKQLKKISTLRKRNVLVYASALTKKADISINFDDRLPFQDQLSNLEGDKIDIILETPGGNAEVAEDIVKIIRSKFSKVGFIIPGYAKSAGTIMAMSGDEILMEPSSALGPIDAQIIQNGKIYSAHAFLEGFKKIKEEVDKTKTLNRAYIPILQNISPADIQGCENAQEFSKILVKEWLSQYKFKFWEKHSKSNKPVTPEEKKARAEEIADELCNHGTWLTHGRSITIKNLRDLKLKIIDYSKDKELYDAIKRYYTLIRMTFDTTNIYKIYETPISQIIKYEIPLGSIKQEPPLSSIDPEKAEQVIIDFNCNKCGTLTRIQTNFKKGVKKEKNTLPFPKDNILYCSGCNTRHDLSAIKLQIESQSKKKIV